MNCDKCDSKIIYVGKTQSCFNLIVDGEVIYDINIPLETYCWICSGCSRRYINDRDSKIQEIK